MNTQSTRSSMHGFNVVVRTGEAQSRKTFHINIFLITKSSAPPNLEHLRTKNLERIAKINEK